jgi:hypothetical protein
MNLLTGAAPAVHSTMSASNTLLGAAPLLLAALLLLLLRGSI